MSEVIIVASDDGEDTSDVSDTIVEYAVKVGAMEVIVNGLEDRIAALELCAQERDTTPTEVVYIDDTRAIDAIDAVAELTARVDDIEDDVADADDFDDPVIIIEDTDPSDDDKPAEHWLTRPWGAWFK